jgi:excisionase family DNA binding protein
MAADPHTMPSTTTTLPPQIDREIAAIIPPERRVLYVHEVAQLICCTTHHVTDLIIEGHINAIRVGTGRRKHYRIPVLALRAFLEREHTGLHPD